LRAKGHQYYLLIIQAALQLFVNCGSSLRGIEKNFIIVNQILLIYQISVEKVPHYSTIRKWLLRIGLYELNREKEYRKDWIFIIDLTIELGTKKCLVILGISQSDYQKKVRPFNRALSHQDVEVLALEILDSTRGEVIEQKISALCEKVGNPIQIIADHGSDLERGIKLYKEKHIEVIYTYDVTHAMALILNHELVPDEKYQSFIKNCHQSKQQLQQTELAFLAPPSQRSKCRYFNVEILINWATIILDLFLSEEDPRYQIRFVALVELLPEIKPEVLKQKIQEKLGWLVNYKEEIESWQKMVNSTRMVETELKLNGLNKESLNTIEQSLLSINSTNKIQQNIREYLTRECAKLTSEKTFLATSDIIESIFGKYKQSSGRSSFKQIGQFILTLSLSTINLTEIFIKQALETISYFDVTTWSEEVFGQSMFSKRKILFSQQNKDIKNV